MIKDNSDIRYAQGCALIKHFNQSLIMKEIFARASYTEQVISDSQKKQVEDEFLTSKKEAVT